MPAKPSLTPKQEEYKRELISAGYSASHAESMARDGYIRPTPRRGRPPKVTK